MKTAIGLLTLILLPFSSVLAADTGRGSLTFYRWNIGYRAESVKVAEITISDSDFRQMLTNAEPPSEIKKSVYTGCYLVNY